MAQSANKSAYEAEANAEPNVVPMIDVMLVLLIIMMIVTPILSTGFTATMPNSKNPDARPEEEDEILLGIDQRGKFYLQKLPVCQPGDASCDDNARLEELLVDIFAARSTDKILFLKADKDIEFGRVQDAVEIARKAGVRVLGAVTERREEMFSSKKGDH